MNAAKSEVAQRALYANGLWLFAVRSRPNGPFGPSGSRITLHKQ